MNNRIFILSLFLLLVLGLAACAGFTQQQNMDTGQPGFNLDGFLVASNNGFARAEGHMTFEFPRDHGPHEDFQTEWWYYTGNLSDENGNRFGYQLTFFRRAVLPVEERVSRESVWGTEQIYLAHFTISDVKNDRFFSYERLSRGAGGLAGATGESLFQVWLEDWSVAQVGEDLYTLDAKSQGVEISLQLVDLKGPVFQGNQGYSVKGPDTGNASYYISQTRLETSGSIRIDENTYSVSGFSWMDHEFSTSALSPTQVGWDWFSIQLDNGCEIMVFTLRDEEGRIDPYSSGTIIYPDGTTRMLSKTDFEIQVTDFWRSPRSKAEYPSGWVLKIPSEELEITIKPLMLDQELQVSFTYWEGAVQVSGRMNGTAVTGYGYVELTGYAQSMQGRF